MLENIQMMLRFGEIASAVMIGAGQIALIAYFATKIACHRPYEWLLEFAIKLTINGIGFYTLFLLLKIAGSNAGII